MLVLSPGRVDPATCGHYCDITVTQSGSGSNTNSFNLVQDLVLLLLKPTLANPACPAGLTAAHPGLGKLIFAVLFPVGLMVTILHGVELFTGNTMKAAMAVYEGKIKMSDLVKNWTVSYIGNFIGSLIILGIVLQTNLLPFGTAAPVKVAVAKCSLTFTEVRVVHLLCCLCMSLVLHLSAVTQQLANQSYAHVLSCIVTHCHAVEYFCPAIYDKVKMLTVSILQAFCRALLANWFVCLAVWCATSANSIPGKLMAIWPPILSFCAFGGEHR